jgi:predicted Rossmann fold nucleotide-binding protein DprA/Smf involved in DNA uptake
MARRNDASLAAILLTQRLVDSSAEPLRAREYWTLLDQVGDPGRLLGASTSDLAGWVGSSELGARIAARFEAATSLAFELEQLEQSGIRVIASMDDEYPARFSGRLGSAAPPVLHVVGPIALLDGPGLGIVGAREISEETAAVTGAVARGAIEQGWSVVSGGSPGVDRVAMDAALAVEGQCAVLLADSLLRVTREPAVRIAVGAGRLGLVTPYPPAAGYTSVNAMGRNKLIYAASDETLVVAADGDNDTTLAGATEALDRGYGSVAVWTGAGGGPSNPTLVDHGARPISNPDQLWNPDAPPDAPPPDQLPLDV